MEYRNTDVSKSPYNTTAAIQIRLSVNIMSFFKLAHHRKGLLVQRNLITYNNQ